MVCAVLISATFSAQTILVLDGNFNIGLCKKNRVTIAGNSGHKDADACIQKAMCRSLKFGTVNVTGGHSVSQNQGAVKVLDAKQAMDSGKP